MLTKAEYVWLDGNDPPHLRSKVRIVDLPEDERPPVWGFDGSSTQQAKGNNSDCVLYPAFVCSNPLEGGIIVLCEVLDINMTPATSNARSPCSQTALRYKEHDCWFGMEQEYVLMKNGRPLSWPQGVWNEPTPQGDYYCGNGANVVAGRDIVNEHLDACLSAGLKICGTNAEVMLGQWEFQVGPLGTVEVADHLWVARFLLQRIAEKFGVSVSYDAKPIKGDWNGSGCHTNFSTKQMREPNGYKYIIDACGALEKCAALHLTNYGTGAEKRLTGKHETCSYEEFKWGVSDRGASVRIPWQVAKEKKGYLEDRRPNANCDPYRVTAIIVESVCGGV